ncbi:MAG: hypothetical protein LC775_08375, partial [Acidobacteria bacterium]|nr:hypothetical protein [Acidobacteriota bacterium]
MCDHAKYRNLSARDRTSQLIELVLGHGVNHAFDSPTGRMRLVEHIATGSREEGAELPPTEDLLAAINEARALPDQAYEWWSLAGPAGSIDIPNFEVGTQHRLGSVYVEDEEDFSAAGHALAKSKAELALIVLFREFNSAAEELSEAANKLGMPIVNLAGELVQYAGSEGVIELLRQLPCRYATYRLRLAKHSNRQWCWTQHDLADIVVLSVAATYCSVVVTERQWTHVLRQAGVS